MRTQTLLPILRLEYKVHPLSVSFVKTVDSTTSLWMILSVSEGLLEEATIHQMVEMVREMIVRQATPKRRNHPVDKLRSLITHLFST